MAEDPERTRDGSVDPNDLVAELEKARAEAARQRDRVRELEAQVQALREGRADEPEQLAAQARQRFGPFIRNRVNADVFERDRNGQPLSPEVFREAAEIGLLGYDAPVEMGGRGNSRAAFGIVLEEVAYLSEDIALPLVLGTTSVTAEMIGAMGREELIERYTKPMFRGERILCPALYEGNDPLFLQSTAQETADGWILQGTKEMVTNGTYGDPFLVFVRDVESDDTLVFLVERDDPGVSTVPIPSLGGRSTGLARLVLDGVKLADDRMLVSADGLGFANKFYSQRRWADSAMLLGMMRRLFEQCVERLRSRVRYGQSVLDFPNVQHAIGQMHVGIESSRAVFHRALKEYEQGGDPTFFGSTSFVAKHHATEVAVSMGLTLSRLLGAEAYSAEYPWERYIRDVLALISAGGAQDVILIKLGQRAAVELERQQLVGAGS